MESAVLPAMTVLFATHNGAATLPRMLRALERLRAPRRSWRILAVDNASTDGTPDILREAAQRLPLTVIACPTPGKAAALRHAAPHVTGDLLVMTDDDVEPAPDWLVAYEAAADAHPDFGLFAGSITPTPLAGGGPWFRASAAYHAELFAKTEMAAGPLGAVDMVFGPNFMLRSVFAPVLESVPDHIGPRFDGVWKRRYPMGQDTRVVMSAIARGARAYGVPAARVQHLIRPHQTDLAFMLDRAFRHGRGSAIELVKRGRSAWRTRAKLILQSLGVRRAPDPAVARPDSETFEKLWKAHWTKGFFEGAAFGPFGT
jgi:hypothetical protein